MDWIYRDFEVRNRLNNIMWTISGEYDEELENLDKYGDISKDLAIYYAIKSGARKKYVDWDIIKKYVAYKVKKGANRQHIISFVEICIDNMIEDKVLIERPGIVEIRQRAYEELLGQFLTTKVRDELEKIKYAIILEHMGKSAMFDGFILRLFNEIKESAEVSDTKELIGFMEDLYNKYFSDYINNEFYSHEELVEELETLEYEEDSDRGEYLYEEIYKEMDIDEDIINSIDNISAGLMVESLGELQQKEDKEDNRVIYVDEEMAGKIYDKIEYYYGAALLSGNEIKDVERKACRNIHEGCRVHFTEGVLRTNSNNAFQTKYVTRQKENNLSYYGQNPRVNKRNITKLKQTILQTMASENEINRVPSDHGEIVANKLWRINRSKNAKVFNEVLKNEKGGYAVDILLDASGSQRQNQGRVATQAYIISQALTMAQIPNRVIGFNSFLDYTILRRYRDYQSPLEDNTNIFEYYAAGNNRDGLALRAVCQGLQKRSEENKILIVLSDGKPNDIKISKNNQRHIKGEAPYKGITAIKDTALEVRQIRNNGILVLGVFTGKEEDLFAEKFIYGKDFIYTRNIDRFSDIVGTFFKSVIINY